MGQIESKDSFDNSNDILDRKQIIGKGERSSASNASNDHNIEIDSDLENKSNDENDKKMSENEEKIQKSKTYDFACTIFYSMVALLVFSTMSRTYTTYTGGGCGALYGAQPLLAYTCVGLACAIIKSLRKHIKESEQLNSEVNAKEPVLNLTGLSSEDDSAIEEKSLAIDLNETNVNFGSGQTVDKLSTGLPLPLLPPPNSLSRKKVSFENSNEIKVLSAIDLKIIESFLEKQENKSNDFNEIKSNELKSINANTEWITEKDSHRVIQYNWSDYDLNSVHNKY